MSAASTSMKEQEANSKLSLG